MDGAGPLTPVGVRTRDAKQARIRCPCDWEHALVLSGRQAVPSRLWTRGCAAHTATLNCMNLYLELVIVASVTALAASAGTWLAGRWLQQCDEHRRGVAASRLVYLELSRNHQSVMAFRKGGRSSQSLGFLSSAAWEALQVDVARIVDRRYIATIALPYFWISTLRAVQGINWLDKGYAKLSGAEREWFTQVEDTSREALDRLSPVVWDKDQVERLRDAVPNDGPRRASTPAAAGRLLGRIRQRLRRQPRTAL